jgi:hypothetical protein
VPRQFGHAKEIQLGSMKTHRRSTSFFLYGYDAARFWPSHRGRLAVHEATPEAIRKLEQIGLTLNETIS